MGGQKEIRLPPETPSLLPIKLAPLLSVCQSSPDKLKDAVRVLDLIKEERRRFVRATVIQNWKRPRKKAGKLA